MFSRFRRLGSGRTPLSLGGSIRRRLFGVSVEEAHFQRRGFRATTPELQAHLEAHASTFLDGYHAALESDELDSLAHSLHAMPVDRQGFAFEGAAMALVLLDRLTPWRRNRWRTFREGVGDPHVYMMHVGAGWALARLRVRPDRMLLGFDPLLRWLVIDGYGFHQGFFHTRSTAQGQPHGRALRGYAGRAFDQGIGRSLWFSRCADPQGIRESIAKFDAPRHSDLWSGVGLAASYAGGVDRTTLLQLVDAAPGFEAELGQGCAFAAKARQRAGNVLPHTETACQVFLGCSVDAAAAHSDEAFDAVMANPRRLEAAADQERLPAYELWRTQVRNQVHAQGANA